MGGARRGSRHSRCALAFFLEVLVIMFWTRFRTARSRPLARRPSHGPLRQRSFRPVLERLENRTVLSTQVFFTDFDAGAPSQFSGVTSTESVQGYAGIGTGSNAFS